MADVITRLRVESSEYDNKIKRAAQGLLQMEQACRKAGGTLAVMEKEELDFVRSLGQMETVSKDARGQISELTKAFTDLSMMYKRLTDEEKNSPPGRALTASLGELKTRIQETKKNLADINQELSGSKFGQFGSLIDGVGKQMGLNANITELVTSKTALMTAGIGAGIAVVGKAATEWKKYNDELAKQDQITTVTTGLTGTSANGMTDSARALADTYKVDFRQAIDAANTLMTQFGQTGDQAMQLLRDGMQGMTQGDGPKLLSMIKQYAPAFRDAGVSASELVAVIHNTEGGIFTDQNMSAIVMGIRNIRLMTKETSAALAQLGIDGQDMSRKLGDGSLTVFDALQQVASKLREVDSNSKTAGEVMQTVFGRQGTTAGTNIAKAIETLNTNLAETKKQTGELGDAFAQLQTANEKLNTAIREAFSYDGWEQMAVGIKSTLISALAEVIDKIGEVRSLVSGISPGQAKRNKYGTTGTPDEVERDLTALRGFDTQIGSARNTGEADAFIQQREQMYQQMLHKYEQRFQASANTLAKAEQRYQENEASSNFQGFPFVRKASDRMYWSARVNTARSNVQADEEVLKEFRANAQKIFNPEKTGIGTRQNPVVPPAQPQKSRTEVQQNQQAIASLTAEYQKLADASKSATGSELTAAQDRMAAIRTEISGLQDRNEELQRWANEAAGKTTGLIDEQTKRAARLNEELSHATTMADIQRINKELEATNDRLTLLRGKLPKGQQAEFTIKVNDSQLADLRKKLPSDTTVTETVNVKPGSVSLPDVPKEIEQVINTKVGEVLTPDVATEVVQTISTKLGDIVTPDVAEQLTQVINTKVGEVLTPDVATEVVQTISTKLGEIVTPDVAEQLTQVINTKVGEVLTPDVATEVVQTISTKLGEIVTPDVAEQLTQVINTKVGEVLTPDVATEVVQTISTKLGEIVTPDVAEQLTQVINTKVGEVLTPDVATEVVQTISTKLGEIVTPDIPEEKTVKVTADTTEAAQAIMALIGEDYSVRIVPKMEMQEGFSGLSTNAIAEWIKDLQNEIDNAEVGTKLHDQLMQNMGDSVALQNIMKTAMQNGLKISDLDWELPWDKILAGEDADAYLQELINHINEKLHDIGQKPIEINLSTGEMSKKIKNVSGDWKEAAGAVQQLGSALQGIEDPAAKVMGIIAQAIATVALTFSKSLAGTKIGPWEWIAAAAAGTATMVSTISAIKSATAGSYAQGGIVPGNSYSGDRLTANVNSGELILSRAQQDNVASALTQTEQRAQVAQPYVQGDKIFLGTNNYLRSSGQGQLVTTKMLSRAGINI